MLADRCWGWSSRRSKDNHEDTEDLFGDVEDLVGDTSIEDLFGKYPLGKYLFGKDLSGKYMSGTGSFQAAAAAAASPVVGKDSLAGGGTNKDGKGLGSDADPAPARTC